MKLFKNKTSFLHYKYRNILFKFQNKNKISFIKKATYPHGRVAYYD